MKDREKVIKGLDLCSSALYCADPNSRCDQCPYKTKDMTGTDEINCSDVLMADALFLLKKQETKTGHWISVNDGDTVAIDNDGFPERACFCSECKKYLIASDEYAVYGRCCPFCGAKMEGW